MRLKINCKLLSIILAVAYIGIASVSISCGYVQAQSYEQESFADDSVSLTYIAKMLTNAIDKMGGDWIDRSKAIFILGIIIITLYRVLQWAVGKAKLPVGSFKWKILTGAISFLLGSDASWKNRVLSKDADKNVENEARVSVLKKLSKDHPLVRDDLKKVMADLGMHSRY